MNLTDEYTVEFSAILWEQIHIFYAKYTLSLELIKKAERLEKSYEQQYGRITDSATE